MFSAMARLHWLTSCTRRAIAACWKILTKRFGKTRRSFPRHSIDAQRRCAWCSLCRELTCAREIIKEAFLPFLYSFSLVQAFTPGSVSFRRLLFEWLIVLNVEPK